MSASWADGCNQSRLVGSSPQGGSACQGKLSLQPDSFQTGLSLKDGRAPRSDRPTPPNRWHTHTSCTSEPERKRSPQVKIILLFESPDSLVVQVKCSES